jgi:nitroreductase
MDVYEAVRTRRAVRGFIDRPVPVKVLERVVSAATWAPSGSNIQPWHIYVVTGARLAELKRLAGARVTAGDPWDEREYKMYPPELKSPYRERKSAFGAQRYGALGIARGDLEARQRAASANWAFFGAPAGLFCYIHRDMGPPQWADVGMYLQAGPVLLSSFTRSVSVCPSTTGKSTSRMIPSGLASAVSASRHNKVLEPMKSVYSSRYRERNAAPQRGTEGRRFDPTPRAGLGRRRL